MSSPAITPVPLTALASLRSVFQPLQAAQVATADAAAVDDYARGLSDGWHKATQEREAENEVLRTLLGSAQSSEPGATSDLSLLIRETVIHLVTQICGQCDIDTALLETQIARALSIITEADEARAIMLHPEDAALVGDTLHALPVVRDPTLARGTVRIDCTHGWAEQGIAQGLERLRKLFEIAP